MAWIFQQDATPNSSVNLSPATGAAAMYALKETLKWAGWSIRSSGDGSTYNSSGDQITHGGFGAGGMANSNAWFRIRTPEGVGGREFTFQRTSANTTWRHKVSHSVGFVGGSPSATQTPSATDEGVVWGSGTDAAPTGTIWFGTDGTYKVHIGAETAAPYDAYLIAAATGTGITKRWWFVNMVPGTYSGLDVAPYLVQISTDSAAETTMGSIAAGPNGIGYGYFKKGLSGESFVRFRAFSFKGGTTPATVNGLGLNPYSGKDTIMPMYSGRLTADGDIGFKGSLPTSMIGWQGSSKSNGDHADVGAVRYAYFDQIAIVYPAGVLPVI